MQETSAKPHAGTRLAYHHFGYLHPKFEVLVGTRWYATVREGVNGDVSWYPKVRGGTRRHQVDACAVLLMRAVPQGSSPRSSGLYVHLFQVSIRAENNIIACKPPGKPGPQIRMSGNRCRVQTVEQSKRSQPEWCGGSNPSPTMAFYKSTIFSPWVCPL